MRLRSLLTATGVIAFMVIVALAAELWRANDWIDQCADETSGKYIRDEKQRAQDCKRDGAALGFTSADDAV